MNMHAHVEQQSSSHIRSYYASGRLLGCCLSFPTYRSGQAGHTTEAKRVSTEARTSVLRRWSCAHSTLAMD